MSRYEVDIILECCGNSQTISFDSRETPYLSGGIYRKNVSCEACGKLLIIDCDTTKNEIGIKQEIVSLT